MIDSVSDNTKATLLLCAPLLIGKNTPMVDLLKPSEYNQLALWLHENKWQPADLLNEKSSEIIQVCPLIDPTRLTALLGRGFQSASIRSMGIAFHLGCEPSRRCPIQTLQKNIR